MNRNNNLSSLERIYHPEDLKEQKERYTKLIEKFSRLQKTDKVFLARAPGRVNLIGEHTDYNHCPVLPCAVDRDIIAVFTPREDGKVLVADFNTEFGEREFEIRKDIPPYEGGNWGNYIKAALQGLQDENILDPDSTKGFSMMIHSTIPSAAGMSSSSAMVVLSALVALEVNGKAVPPVDLAEMMARAERYTGTQGGGMDQAAILLGHKDMALKIDFAPLSCATTPFPEDYQILVAHSTVQAPKTKEIMDKYNRRSIECRLAAAVISVYEQNRGMKSCRFLGELNPDYPVQTALKEGGYSKMELQNILKMDGAALDRNFCLRKDGTIFPEPAGGFLLRKRAEHVISEWKRVEESARLLKLGNMIELGKLMFASHESCRDNHEISCLELDELIASGKELNSPGCRLTGAGFGGCTVHLVKKDNLKTYRDGLVDRFYTTKMKITETDEFLFSVYPSEGAQILTHEKRS